MKTTKETKKDLIETLGALLVALVFTLVVLGVFYFNDYHKKESYSTGAIVLTTANNQAVLVDGSGEMWSVNDRPDLHKDDFVEIYFDDNKTDYTRKDDIILSVVLLDE